MTSTRQPIESLTKHQVGKTRPKSATPTAPYGRARTYMARRREREFLIGGPLRRRPNAECKIAESEKQPERHKLEEEENQRAKPPILRHTDRHQKPTKPKRVRLFRGTICVARGARGRARQGAPARPSFYRNQQKKSETLPAAGARAERRGWPASCAAGRRECPRPASNRPGAGGAGGPRKIERTYTSGVEVDACA